MNKLESIANLKDIDIGIQIIKFIFIILFTYYSFYKIINKEKLKTKSLIILLITSPIISVITKYTQYSINEYVSSLILILLITLVNIVNQKKDFSYVLLITIISLAISYTIHELAILIAFFPNLLFGVLNDWINLIIILCIYSILIIRIFKIKKIKHGISFLQKRLENSYFSVLLLNICAVTLFLIINMQHSGVRTSQELLTTLIVLAITMFVTIKQSFDMYYKQNLLTKDLEQTKSELESTKKELEQANKDNLEISEKIHTLNHRQKSLQHQLDKLSSNDEKATEYIKNQLNSISEEIYQEPEEVDIAKTDIPVIDNMLEYMLSECKENNIKFEIQVLDNIHYMINNLISEKDMEILLADHIKDAIIAINHSENSNRSILVRLGKINEFYSLYIYDSGIEFTKEVLEKLGKEPITTHKDSGGTGMGFMNTFNTLNKTKASLIIKEIGEPVIDNYTKAIIIRFDSKNEFKVESYKKEILYTN